MKFIEPSYLYMDSRIDIFCPFYNEYLWDIISIIKKDNKYISDKLLREFTLSYINEMITKDIIYIGSEWDKQDQLIKWIKSKEQIINEIDKMWFKNATYPDFLEMIWFGYKGWYVKKLKSLGFGKDNTLWRNFVKYKIGNLEQWIDQNKP